MEIIFRESVEGHPERWMNTSGIRSDNKEEYRERKEFGNRHVIFENGTLYGTIHHDKYNATNFPVGTVQHISKYTEEKTGIPQDWVTGAIVGVVAGLSLYAGYKTAKWVSKKL